MAVLLLAGCTHGPPELHIAVANHAMAPDGRRVGFAVHALRSRQATGLSAFPDGGVPLVLNEGVAIYLCDTATLKVDRVWQQDRPQAFRSGFGPWMGPWTEQGIYFSVRGYTTTTTDPAAFRRVDYLLGREGIDSGVTEPPLGPSTPEPTRCAEVVRRTAEAEPPFAP
jgi:hypothetical protein